MHRHLLSLLALAAVALPTAAFGLECPAQEKVQQHGMAQESFCVPRQAQECGAGRKFNVRSRAPMWGFCDVDPNARHGSCAAGEVAESKRSRDYCKPGPGNGGMCGKGRKNAPADWDPNLVICKDDKRAAAGGAHQESLSCPNGERAYHPTQAMTKPYCEAVDGRCGFGRAAVNEIPGHKRCVAR